MRKNAASPRVTEEMDRMRKGVHGIAAVSLIDALNDVGLHCGSINFCKQLFTLLQVVSPMNNDIAKQMSKAYDPNDFSF